MSGGTACSVVVVVEIDSYIAENKIDPKKKYSNGKTQKPRFFLQNQYFFGLLSLSILLLAQLTKVSCFQTFLEVALLF